MPKHIIFIFLFLFMMISNWIAYKVYPHKTSKNLPSITVILVLLQLSALTLIYVVI